MSYFGSSTKRQIEILVSKDPPVIEDFQASQQYILANMPIELSWRVGNAEKVEISSLERTVYGSTGTATVKLSESSSIVITASSYFGIKSSKTIHVYVIPVPIIESLFAPRIELDVRLNITIVRPILPNFSSAEKNNAFPWITLNEKNFLQSDINIPKRGSIWRLPEFGAAFEAIKASAGIKLQELIDLLKIK